MRTRIELPGSPAIMRSIYELKPPILGQAHIRPPIPLHDTRPPPPSLSLTRKRLIVMNLGMLYLMISEC
jgi:hypothetical protein